MIWIDVNQLVHWRGPLSGIQRTQFEFARAASIHDDVRFFFQDVNGQSVEYFFDSQALASQFDSVSKFKNEHSSNRLIVKIIGNIQRRFSSSNTKKKNGQAQNDLPNITLFKQGDMVLFVGASWIQELAVKRAVATSGVSVGVLLYDMIPIIHPEYFRPGYGEHFTKFIFEGLSGVDFFMSISDTTTNDFLRLCQERGIPPKPIIRLELGSAVNELESVRPSQLSEEETYVLSVGTIEIRKNYDLLYEAWLLAEQKGIPLPTLVIAGKQGWLAEETFNNLARARHKFAKIQVLESVSDSQLNWLYQHALFTLYPSLYEGWGLPITESLAVGKLCVAADTPASREAGQGLSVHVDSHDSIALLNSVRTLATNYELLNSYEMRIRNTFIPTSWEDSVPKVLSEIKKLES